MKDTKAKTTNNNKQPQVTAVGQTRGSQPGLTPLQAGLGMLQDAAGNQAVSQLMQAPPAGEMEPTQHQEYGESGQPLEQTTKNDMEARFGKDLGDVRLHTGSAGAQVANRHRAHAVTIGQDIYVSSDTYSPGTAEGRALLAHELAHTIQYTNGRQRSPAPEVQLESEAAVAGLYAAAGRPAQVQGAASGAPLALTREEKAGIGAGIGTGVGALLGGFGLAIAAAAGAALGAGAIVGALLGGAVLGAGLGALIGYLQRRTTPVTPEEADRLIRGRFGDNLQEAIAASTQAEGRIQVVDDAAYRVAYEAHYGSIDEDYPFVNAFVDRSTTPPTVWIHEERQTPATVIHEALHLYSDPAMRTNYGKAVNEGTTEYFTRQIVEEQHLEQRSGIYDNEYAAIQQLAEVVGEDTLRQAYFEGKTTALETAVDNAREAGTFAIWLGHMQAEEWDEARDALASSP